MATVHWQVAGMTCGGCTSRLDKLLNAAAGVEAARAELVNQQVAITYDPAKIQAEALKRLIEDAGFEVRP